MNDSSNKLTADEIDAWQRLLFAHADNFSTAAEFERYMSDVASVIPVPDGLLAEACNAFSPRTGQIQHAYQVLQHTNDASFEEAVVSMRRIIQLSDDDVATIN